MAVRACGGLELADDLLERRIDVGPERRVLRHQAVEHIAVGPEAVLDGVGVDGAVGVVPADGGGAPAGLVSVGEDGLLAIDGRPFVVSFVVHPQAVVEVVADAVDDLAGKQRGNDLYRVVSGGLGVGKERALGAEGVEVGQVQVARAVLEDLVVGEFIEDHPDQQRMLARALGRCSPRGGDLVRRRLPGGHPEQLGGTA